MTLLLANPETRGREKTRVSLRKPYTVERRSSALEDTLPADAVLVLKPVETTASPSTARAQARQPLKPQPQSTSATRRPPFVAVLVALGLLAAGGIYWGITVLIKDKDGKVIGKVELAEGTAAEIHRDGKRIADVPGGNIDAATLASLANGPPLAIAPFDKDQAKAHQGAWAKHLAVPVEFTNSIGMKFVFIPPQQVKGFLLSPFYLSKYETTVAQFRRFAEETKYVTDVERLRSGFVVGDLKDRRREFASNPEATWRNPGFAQKDADPVCLVSWNDALKFCEWLSAKETVAYSLPSHRDWRSACLAGGRSIPELPEFGNDRAQYCWLLENSELRTHPVGSLKANPWGLHDMGGNVMEWNRDPFGAAADDRRVLIGEGFHSKLMPTDGHGQFKADSGISTLGFRVQLSWQSVLKTPKAEQSDGGS